MAIGDSFLKELQNELIKSKARWKAEKNFTQDLSDEERKLLLGYTPGPDEMSLEEQEKHGREKYEKFMAAAVPPEAMAYPARYDLRNAGGRNFITSVKDQGSCGSCVAFGTAAAMEGGARVLTDTAVNDPGGSRMADLSEAHLFYCGAGKKCDEGWYPFAALDFAESTGVTTESCFPYTAGNQPCKPCSDWQQKITQLANYHYISDHDEMKTWLSTRGPLVTAFTVYSDFYLYFSGVYHHKWGSKQGGHCVCCVGYDDNRKAWLCKNSWGSWWGWEGGYFWIGYGECGIDAGMYAIDSFSKIYPLYDDVFMRDNLSDIGAVPATGSANHSPDIIPAGTEPVADPVSTYTDNWRKDPGKDVSAGRYNYIYVRGKNLFIGPQQADVHLYYSKASLILWPSVWKNNVIKTETEDDHVTVSPSRLGEIFVSPTPFLWKPEPIEDYDHYCFVSRVVTSQHPNPIPKDGNINDFAKYVLNNPGVAWRNVRMVNTGDTPSFEALVNLQVTNEVELYMVLECQNIPVGCQARFQCGTPGPEPLIETDKVTIEQSDSFVFGIKSQIPENFKSDITVSFWTNGNKLQSQGTLTFVAYYIVPTGHELEQYSRPIRAMSLAESPKDTIGPEKGIAIGTYRFVVN